MTITVVLADDHQVVRQGIRALLEAEPDMEVIGEASTGPQAIEVAEALRPDVLVLDLSMPGLNGLAVTHEVSKGSPNTKTVVFSMHVSDGYVTEALRSGALGYVLKDAPSAELVEAVRVAHTGRRFLSSSISQRAIEVYLEHGMGDELQGYETLSPREREVLQLVVNGLTNNEIARQLSLSHRTIESHRAALMRKLGLKSLTELIGYASAMGIAPPIAPDRTSKST